MTDETFLNMYEALDRAEVLYKTIYTITLQNSFINQVKAPNTISIDEVFKEYRELYKNLRNMCELNQQLTKDLDDVATYLHGIADEINKGQEQGEPF